MLKINYLNESQRENLEAAFKSLCNLSFSSEKDNHSNCGVFHIKPFNDHWDEQTVKEVMYHVKLFIDTWAIYPMEEALKLKRLDVEAEMKKQYDNMQQYKLSRSLKQ